MKLLPPSEAAEFLGLKASTLSVWRSTGRYDLPFHKIGGRVFYAKKDLKKWLNGKA
jgi:predicted site-specific integrase-resolvase